MLINSPPGRTLVPLDGSELAEAILPLVEGPTHPWGSEILLVRAVTKEGSTVASAEAEARHYLARQSGRLQSAGLRVRCEVWHGDPSQTILNAAARGRANLIAMTTHGWRGLDRLRFGSVAETVVRQARVPVLLVRGAVRWPIDHQPRILVPLDGSALSTAVLAVIAKLRESLPGIVELLHVLDGPPSIARRSLSRSGTDARSIARHYLERVAARLIGSGFEVQWSVVEGPVKSTIAQRAAAGGADLVAMTTHGRRGVARALLGSVAEHVLRTATVPVLLWKAPRPQVRTQGERRLEEARHAV